MKKNFIKSVVIFCLTAMCWTPANAQDIMLFGDVNQDGSVNIEDVTALINYLLTDGMPAKTYTVNGVSFNMIPVQGGTFTMGSDYGASYNERPAHQVSLSRFSLAETEVTQALWQAVMGTNPSYFTGDLNLPVENVSWDDCQEFIAKLNQMTGKNFRLPTEAEWEFAARGGNLSKDYYYSGSNSSSEVAWCDYNASSQTHPVASKLPNELGFYDMSGNACEWVQDWFGDYSSEAQTNPTGPTTGTSRVVRGGSWLYSDIHCRPSDRGHLDPTRKDYNNGLRLAM